MNRAYQLTPVSMYDVRGLEKWLEKLAARGLFLKKFRPLVCTFTKGEPKRARYRLEPFHVPPGDGPPGDMLELFQECGWACAGDVRHEMLIFSTNDPHAPELHTDPDIQLEQWNRLYQKARKEFHQMVLLTLACLAVCAAMLFWGGTPLTKLLLFRDLTLWAGIYLVLYPLKEFCINFSRARELSGIIRELEGAPPKKRLWFPSRLFFSWLLAAWVAFLLGLILFVLCNPELGDYQPITDFTPLTLSELEAGEREGLQEYYGRPGWSPICWRQWNTWDFQEGSVMDIQWFDLPKGLSFLAVPAAKDLRNSAMKLDDVLWSSKEPVYWVTRDHPEAGADWLSTADSEDGTHHIAAAALGSKVVLVRYAGPRSLEPHLGKIVEMVR